MQGKFKVSTKITASCAKPSESSRYAWVNPLVVPVDGETVALCATDGHQLAVRLEPGTIDAERVVPIEVIPTTKSKNGHDLTANGDWKNDKGQFAPEYHNDFRFPPTDGILPADTKGNESLEYVYVGLDPKLLARLAEAIGSPDGISIAIPIPRQEGYKSVTKPIIVMGGDDNDNGVGVLMPKKITFKPERYEHIVKTFSAARRAASTIKAV